jgi:SAM-dependent methyltransferase
MTRIDYNLAATEPFQLKSPELRWRRVSRGSSIRVRFLRTAIFWSTKLFSSETIASMKVDEAGRSQYPENPTQSAGFRVVEDEDYGFRHLDPIPPEAELTKFYEGRYYDLVRKGNRAPELRRIMQGGDPASQELRWLREGLYTDIVGVINNAIPGRRLVEVGCGTGDFLSFATEHGFSAVGTEPAAEAAQRGVARGLTIHTLTLDEFVVQSSAEFDVVVMLNVLEHVPDAVRTLKQCSQMLAAGGILCIRVPNDFSEIQGVAQQRLKADPWWIAVPDHINYFNFASLKNVLGGLGFETIYAQGDFPMEMFLLMGENYVGNPEVGGSCHARRVQFDLSLPPDLRRKIYSALGNAGVGRDCLVFGKKLQS